MRISGSDVKSKVFFSVLFVLVFFFGAALMPYFAVNSVLDVNGIVPDLLFALSIVCGIIYENRRAASVISLVAGVLSDIFITPPVHFSPILFFLGAYFASKTVSVFTNTNAVTAAVASIPFFFMRAAVGCVYLMSENSGLNLGVIIRTTVLPELALNITAVFFVYIIVNFLYKRFKRRFYI